MTGLNSPAGPELWTCSHTVGSDYLGYTRNCELGIEALDANGVLLGVFANEDDADNAIFNCWDKKLRSNSGGSDTPSPPKAEGDSFCWFDRLSDEQKDAALDHMLECIAARNSSLLDVQNDNNLIPEIARSGAPHAAEISRRHVQKRNGADFAHALRECFARRPKSPIGPLIHAAYECGANLEPWWRLVLDVPTSPLEPTNLCQSAVSGEIATSTTVEPAFEPSDAPSDILKPHVCIHCRLDPPDGTERTLDNGVWIHSRCEAAYITARMAEEGLSQEDASAPLEPGRNHLKIFIQGMFRHCDKAGVVSLRSFYQNNVNKAFSIKPIPLEGGLNFLIEAAVNEARRTANNHEPVAFTPPVATFKASAGWRARQEDLLEGPVLAVDLDKNPRTALATLERLLGPATLVVRSGGQWTNPETGEIEDKLHAYWRLKKPARDEGLKKLKELRKLATALVNGDPSNVPINHPIRWPGSWHRKSTPRPCEIVNTNHLDAEIDLDAALKTLQKAAPAFARRDPDRNTFAGGERPQLPPLPFAPIKEGCPWLQHVYNTGGRDQSEPLWWDALRCCIFLEDGEKLIHEFSNKHVDYDFEDTEAKYDLARKAKEDKDLGWPQCLTIHEHKCEHCETCPHLAAEKSPLNLALRVTLGVDKKWIRIVGGEIAHITDEAEAALLAVADVAPIMVRAEALVQPIIDLLPAAHARMTQVVLLRRLTAANVIYLLNKHAAIFEKFDKRSKKWLIVDPPQAVATQLLEKRRWQFPKVAGVITTPTLRPDGTILDRPGYDPATQLWYSPDSQVVLPQLIEKPTREQAKQALKLLTDLLPGFPFEGDVYRSVALAAILTAVLRGAFDVVPMNLWRAPDVGSGKSYLADLISIIARGQLCPVITSVESVEEMEKRLGALVLEGVQMISLDNCSHDIGGDLLCQITERRLIRIRILGKSEAPECEWRGVLHATGNNITYRADMARRGLVGKLDAKVERPELRTFDFDPIKRVLADRGSYIAAVITIARAYLAAGSPEVCGPLGSYEPWNRMVRSALIWLGQEDPVKSMDEAREEDPVRRAEQQFIAIWRDQLGPNITYTAAKLIKKANQQKSVDIENHTYESGWEYPQLHELLLQQAGDRHGDIDARKLGNWLMSICGRVRDGYCIARVKESKSWGNIYALVKQ